jgi:anti-sigma factor RsiW
VSQTTCTWVRQQLAVYRPEDTDQTDLERVSQHLETCSACRRVQVDFRQSGDLIRRLPVFTPPPAFRTAVFAAIRSETMKQTATVNQISRAVTNPEMPAVVPSTGRELPPPPIIGVSQPYARGSRRFRLRMSIAVAAAVLLMSLLGARILSLIGTPDLSGSAANLDRSPTSSRALQYPLSSHSLFPTGAMATSSWLVYTATDTTNRSVIMAENRVTHKTIQLMPVPSTSILTVRALTDHWVIWTAGDGTSAVPWRLFASSLVSAGNAPPLSLVDTTVATPTTLVTLGGIWASADLVLVAGAPRTGTGEVLKFDLSTGAAVPTVVAHGQASGDILTDPSFDNGTYYWADVRWDSATGLHSSIWKGNGATAPVELSPSESAFHPQVSQNMLVWVDVDQAKLEEMANSVGNGTPDSDMELLYSLGGLLYAQNLLTGQESKLSSQAKAESVVVAGKLLLWQSGVQIHAYDLTHKTPLAVDSQMRSASLASATSSAITWLEASVAAIFVYDAAA